MPMPDSFKEAGYEQEVDTDIVIRSWESIEQATEAEKLILNSEVVLNGGENIYTLLKKRLDKGLLTFDVGERWLKKGLLNLFSPKLFKFQLYYHLFFYNKRYYRLNAGAFAADDMRFLKSFKNKMFKWGYFTAVPENFEKKLDYSLLNEKIKILSVARFIDWKHPELAIRLAENLRNKGCDFELNMYGTGPLWNSMQQLVDSKNLQNYVRLKGNISNENILEEMRSHHIFILTSDKNEGWGAVINEAMAQKCAVVVSDEVGSAPFLIDNNLDGLIFKSGSDEDLTRKVESLIKDPKHMQELGENAFFKIKNEWSPEKAARNLLKLINGINSGKIQIVEKGPCSPASPMNVKM